MDNSYIESAIIHLFMIDITQLIHIKGVLLKNFHLAPSEIDRMPYWEYEYLIMDLNQQVKEDNEQQQSELDKYNIQGLMKSARSAGKANPYPKGPQLPKMPDIGSMKLPKI